MFESINPEHHRDFEDRGQRWAHCMFHRLQDKWLDIPLVWPGTREQAETIVHAFTDELLAERDRQDLVEVVQRGARGAWRNITATAGMEGPQPTAQ